MTRGGPVITQADIDAMTHDIYIGLALGAVVLLLAIWWFIRKSRK
jgi:hypothetical protein